MNVIPPQRTLLTESRRKMFHTTNRSDSIISSHFLIGPGELVSRLWFPFREKDIVKKDFELFRE